MLKRGKRTSTRTKEDQWNNDRQVYRKLDNNQTRYEEKKGRGLILQVSEYNKRSARSERSETNYAKGQGKKGKGHDRGQDLELEAARQYSPLA